VYPGGFNNVSEGPAQFVVTDLYIDPATDGRQNLANEFVESVRPGACFAEAGCCSD